jgi:hypothetical protein
MLHWFLGGLMVLPAGHRKSYNYPLFLRVLAERLA